MGLPSLATVSGEDKYFKYQTNVFRATSRFMQKDS